VDLAIDAPAVLSKSCCHWRHSRGYTWITRNAWITWKVWKYCLSSCRGKPRLEQHRRERTLPTNEGDTSIPLTLCCHVAESAFEPDVCLEQVELLDVVHLQPMHLCHMRADNITSPELLKADWRRRSSASGTRECAWHAERASSLALRTLILGWILESIAKLSAACHHLN
jgi:hypothetical protein